MHLTHAVSRLLELLRVDAVGDRREHVIGVAADEPDGANHDHQDHGQHHRVLGDVLPFVIATTGGLDLLS